MHQLLGCPFLHLEFNFFFNEGDSSQVPVNGPVITAPTHKQLLMAIIFSHSKFNNCSKINAVMLWCRTYTLINIHMQIHLDRIYRKGVRLKEPATCTTTVENLRFLTLVTECSTVTSPNNKILGNLRRPDRRISYINHPTKQRVPNIPRSKPQKLKLSKCFLFQNPSPSPGLTEATH